MLSYLSRCPLSVCCYASTEVKFLECLTYFGNRCFLIITPLFLRCCKKGHLTVYPVTWAVLIVFFTYGLPVHPWWNTCQWALSNSQTATKQRNEWGREQCFVRKKEYKQCHVEVSVGQHMYGCMAVSTKQQNSNINIAPVLCKTQGSSPRAPLVPNGECI